MPKKRPKREKKEIVQKRLSLAQGRAAKSLGRTAKIVQREETVQGLVTEALAELEKPGPNLTGVSNARFRLNEAIADRQRLVNENRKIVENLRKAGAKENMLANMVANFKAIEENSQQKVNDFTQFLKDIEKKIKRIVIKKRNLARQEAQLNPAIKRLMKRPVSDEEILEAYREFGRKNPDVQEIKRIESRLAIHSGDLKTIILRMERIIRLEMALNGDKGIREGIQLTIKKIHFKDALEKEKRILAELKKKRKKLRLY